MFLHMYFPSPSFGLLVSTFQLCCQINLCRKSALKLHLNIKLASHHPECKKKIFFSLLSMLQKGFVLWTHLSFLSFLSSDRLYLTTCSFSFLTMLCLPKPSSFTCVTWQSPDKMSGTEVFPSQNSFRYLSISKFSPFQLSLSTASILTSSLASGAL